MSTLQKHSFTMPKKILFINNKGGVGKTTIAVNTAVKLAQKGYRACIVDLDPQCNTTMYLVGNEDENTTNLFNENYENKQTKSIYEIIKPQIDAIGDVLYSEKPVEIQDNLFLIRGDLSMSLFEESASNAYTQSAIGQTAGFRIISAVERYINYIGIDLEIDFFIMDTSPNLGMMNRLFLLGADHFVVPVVSDAFSYQGIENLGTTLTRWKDEWKIIKLLSKSKQIPANLILDGDPKCLGYISNKEKPYGKKQTKAQSIWAQKIKEIAEHSLVPHTNKNKNNLEVRISGLADYGTITNESQKNNKAIFQLTTQDTTQINLGGSKELYEKANDEFETLTNEIIIRLEANY